MLTLYYGILHHLLIPKTENSLYLHFYLPLISNCGAVVDSSFGDRFSFENPPGNPTSQASGAEHGRPSRSTVIRTRSDSPKRSRRSASRRHGAYDVAEERREVGELLSAHTKRRWRCGYGRRHASARATTRGVFQTAMGTGTPPRRPRLGIAGYRRRRCCCGWRCGGSRTGLCSSLRCQPSNLMQ